MRCFAAPALAAAVLAQQADDWRPLFNGRDLSGWEIHLGELHGQFQGMTIPPERAFTVHRGEGGPTIRVDGAQWGALTTTESFGDFHWRLEYRWGPNQWPPLPFRDSSRKAPRSTSATSRSGGSSAFAQQGRHNCFLLSCLP